jgi:predicted membrane protein
MFYLISGVLNVGLLCDLQVIPATNHADIRNPALMRSGHLDQKTDFPHPSENLAGILLWPLKFIVAQ